MTYLLKQTLTLKQKSKEKEVLGLYFLTSDKPSSRIKNECHSVSCFCNLLLSSRAYTALRLFYFLTHWIIILAIYPGFTLSRSNIVRTRLSPNCADSYQSLLWRCLSPSHGLAKFYHYI